MKRMRVASVALAAVLGASVASAQAASARLTRTSIPPRPEKLTFPPLVYAPPAPADYRVKLASGPV
ncbi:MAG TPA: hypothetical protein VK389_05440, partial [Thermoanaerobaculia bacterium]|nr:hypothetical protein [Thermoanaerobaculia bacterium]